MISAIFPDESDNQMILINTQILTIQRRKNSTVVKISTDSVEKHVHVFLNGSIPDH